jgi:hypothetical protein
VCVLWALSGNGFTCHNIVVLKIPTNTAVFWSIVLNINCSYTIYLSSLLYGRNTVETLCRKYPVGAVYLSAKIHNIVTKSNCMGLVMDWTKLRERQVLSEEKVGGISTRLHSSPKKCLRLFLHFVLQICTTRWYKVAKVTALQNYSSTYIASILWRKNSILPVVLDI